MGHSLLWLYGAHALRYLLPLSVIPYLSRTLGPHEFGALIFVQAYAGFLGQVLEYGFGMSKTRDVALLQNRGEQLTALASSVFGAQVLLLLAGLPITLVAYFAFPPLRDDPALLGFGVLAIALQSLQPTWLFKGLEKLQLVARLDMLQRVLRTVCIFALVRGSRDAWLVCLSDTLAGAVAFGMALPTLRRSVRLRIPSLSQARSTLREGADAFAVRLSTNLFTSGTNLVLGALGTPSAVALFGSVERIFSAMRSALAPVHDALLPRITRQIHESRSDARHQVRRYLWLSFLVTLPTALGLFLAAPLIVRVLLGEQFEGAVDPFRVLCLTLPAAVANLFMGSLWLFPLGYDRLCARIGVLGGLVTVVGTTIACLGTLVPPHQGAALAYSLGFLAMTLVFGYAFRSIVPNVQVATHD